MKAIGIGGAGNKVAAKLDDDATLVNVSQTEMDKIEGSGRRINAPVHSTTGQFKGSRKNPEIGMDAYNAIRRELSELIRGSMVISSTGGGTGNGITTGILKEITDVDDIDIQDKTFFCLILPYDKLESAEYVSNSINFMQGPLAEAIDKGNTGNIVLFSNQKKFEEKIAEDEYNGMMVESLKIFLDIPDKNDRLKLLDGHIDHEDFTAFIAKPYFNHFNYFEYNPAESFEKQLDANNNELLLPPEDAIEAMFLVEVPKGGDPTIFYDILTYFKSKKVSPIYSVVENPDIKKPFVTVSRLYSRKPAELVDEFNQINEENVQAKVDKSIEQHVELKKMEVNLEKEAKAAGKKKGVGDDVLATLKRIGKL
ncbi:MAG: hypothetical protein J6X55_06925 [Victivallales bacterium]|nr:hypothetical protein [Victivallales bacterium]